MGGCRLGPASDEISAGHVPYGARVTTWEYRRLSTEIGTGQPELPVSEDDWMVRLTSAGAEGWEAVGPVVLHDQPGDVRFLLLKRPGRS